MSPRSIVFTPMRRDQLEQQKISKEFSFIEIDSTLPPKAQQEQMRTRIAKLLSLKKVKVKKS